MPPSLRARAREETKKAPRRTFKAFPSIRKICPPQRSTALAVATGTIPKPKIKKTILERARALPIVQVALQQRALAVAATVFPELPLAELAPAPDSLPPPPYFPPFQDPNGIFGPSVGSFESSGEAEAPSAPVGPDAL